MACPFAALQEEAAADARGQCPGSCSVESSGSLPVIPCAAQPLGEAVVTQVLPALDYLGQPLEPSTTAIIQAAVANPNDESTNAAIQNALDPHCLAVINVNPESRVKLQPGLVKPVLVESGWTVFLVKVHNEAGVTAPLRGMSPNAASTRDSPTDKLRDRWLGLAVFDREPMKKTLSGLTVEYRLVQLYSRDAGMREAKILFDVGQGTQDLGFRNEIDLLFKCLPAQHVVLRVLDENDEPCCAGFEIRDNFGRIYPALSKRTAPDDACSPEICRGDGDALRLSLGRYTVKITGGPEMVSELRVVDVTHELTELSFKVPKAMPTTGSDLLSQHNALQSGGTAGTADALATPALWCVLATVVVASAVGVRGAAGVLRWCRTV